MSAQFGISVALLTPFDSTGQIDQLKLAAHAADVIARGASGITLFGTTGEGASIGLSERATTLEAATASGIDPTKITLGICATAAQDAIAQIDQGTAAGVTKVLLPPPYYFNGVAEDGLFEWYTAVLGGTDPETRAILYHIPQVTDVPLPHSLIARLCDAFGSRIAGIKDSSGDWANAETLLRSARLPVLIGDERLLHRGVPLGCAGAITGMANLYPARLSRILATGSPDPELSAQVDAVVARPVIAALKTMMARATGDAGWDRLRAPLTSLAAEDAGALCEATAEDARDG